MRQKPVGLAVLVNEKLVYGAGEFRQMVGIDPMHSKAPCVAKTMLDQTEKPLR